MSSALCSPRHLLVLASIVGFSALAQDVQAAPPAPRPSLAAQTSNEAKIRARRRPSGKKKRVQTSTGPDATKIPALNHPTLHARRPPRSSAWTSGWSQTLSDPPYVDRRQRLAAAPLPPTYGHTLKVGERFVFDIYFANNPAGMAEAGVIAYEPPRTATGTGMYQLEGRSVTSGVVSLLSELEDRIQVWVDAESGIPVHGENRIDRSGFGAKYKKRVISTDFEGRGYVRIIDDRDGKIATLTRELPRDTFDPMSAMAWVRGLNLNDGERATAHVLDGKALLRLEIVGRGRRKLEPWPSIATGLGADPDAVKMLEGTLTRVTRHDVVREGKRKFTFRAFVSDDDQRLLLSIETDMWLGVLRLVLSRYDPPNSPTPAAQSPSP